MKQITIKLVIMRVWTFVLLSLRTVSASAQYYMDVSLINGQNIKYMMTDLDSVVFTSRIIPDEIDTIIEIVSPDFHNSYEYVDLGLSVNWATCNVGANKPEEYGDYYAWGETETKSSYTYDNYRFIYSGNSYTSFMVSKYCFDASKGVVDNKTTLDPDDDVAHVRWGGNWRMPTKAEFEELINNCSWNWCTLNGVDGYRVYSNVVGYTDKSIFIPAVGYFKKDELVKSGLGCYWSGSLYSSDSRHGNFLMIKSNSYSMEYYDYCRYIGLSVRPVCP